MFLIHQNLQRILRPAVVRFITAVALSLWVGVTYGQVSVQQPWIQATAPEQLSTVAFMTLASTEEIKLIGVTSPMAEHVEIHETKTEKGFECIRLAEKVTVRMSEVVSMKPGGMHLVLTGLSQQILVGDWISLELTLQNKAGTVMYQIADAKAQTTQP